MAPRRMRQKINDDEHDRDDREQHEKDHDRPGLRMASKMVERADLGAPQELSGAATLC